MSARFTYCLSVGGLDPSAGAGILADIKTFEQCGVYGLAACTAITFQTEDEFNGVSWIPVQEIEMQVSSLLKKYDVEFAKIGLIKNLEELEQLTLFFQQHFPKTKLIWDPILKASAGFEFHPVIDQAILSRVLKNIFLITPNHDEAAKLTNEKNGFQAAQSLSAHCHVFAKSIYKEEQFGDVLFEKNGAENFFKTTSIYAPKHGSGCVLSSALTSFLACGYDLTEACRNAKEYTAAFLQSSEGLLGFHHKINAEEHA